MTSLNPARADLLQMFALDARITRAKGVHLYDDKGREYLDFLSQYGALPFGHNPPAIWDALMQARQEEMPIMVQPLRPVEAERLAERLAELAPGDLEVVTFANSGAETVEAAIKLARIRTGRAGILSTLKGFHGKTLGALSASGTPVYQEGFRAPAPGFDHVPYGDLDALRTRIEAQAGEIAAFVVEPIQGEGGVVEPPSGYIDGAIALCREHGVLSIIDEIQTGLGRTGRLFACEDGSEVPDMLLLSKALGGGMMPIGACIVRPSAWDDRFGEKHSSTFANSNLSARAANATLDTLLADDRALIRGAAESGAYLRRRLEALKAAYPKVIRSVRGQGLMCGIELQPLDAEGESATMAFASLNGAAVPMISSYLFHRQSVLTAPLFNSSQVMRLQPALITGPAEIDRATAALASACEVIAREDYHELFGHLARPERIVAARVSAANPRPALSRSQPVTPQPGRFAFLIHYTEEADILRSDPSFAKFGSDRLSHWGDWIKQVGPGKVRRLNHIISPTGASAEGWLMSVPLLPADMMGDGRRAAAAMIRDAVDMAVGQGASRIGLGAFTSIATRGGEMATGRGADVTSGNTLTTICAVEGLENVAARAGIDLGTAHVAIVGASGAIGRLAALMLASKAGRISLIGNPGNVFSPRLLNRVANQICGELVAGEPGTDPRPGALARRLRQIAPRLGLGAGSEPGRDLADRLVAAMRATGDQPPPLAWNVPLDSALADADVVLVATSSNRALIDPRRLRDGTLVCDVSRPTNVLDAAEAQGRVLIFDGGLVRPPFSVDLGPFRTLPPDMCWGCLGETMLLSLAREPGDYSIGSQLSLSQADRLADLARLHRFTPSHPQWHGLPVTEKMIDNFASHVHRRKTQRRPAPLWPVGA